MGKLKGKNIPRKLKKEFKKVDCIEKTQPRFNYPQNPFQTSKFEFTTYQRTMLKDGVKVNRWTQRLVRNIYREIKREHKQALDRMIENQKAWARKGISPIDSFAEAMKRKSSVEFRREYLNEPIPENDAVFKGLPELGRYTKAIPGYIQDTLLVQRHPDIMHRFGKEISRNPNDQGFYTSKGRFVTREEGLEIARAAGQVDKTFGVVLTSEDLY